MTKAELIAIAKRPGYDRDEEEARAKLRRWHCPSYGGDPLRTLWELATRCASQ